MQLAVGTVGRAHGLRGEVAVDVRTDRPAERFAVGGALATDRGPWWWSVPAGRACTGT